MEENYKSIIKWIIGKNRSFRFGYTKDRLGRHGCPYMKRDILWLGKFTLRMHYFLNSDNDGALHDHPWWFITFPLGDYTEWIPIENVPPNHKIVEVNDDHARIVVKRFRFHYRPASYKHEVVILKPARTFVLSGTRARDWGFWKDAKTWIFWKDWTSNSPMPGCYENEKNG